MVTSNDEVVFNFLKHKINKGDVLVDVGANIGIYTGFFFDYAGKSGRIYSIEINKDTFNSLKHAFKDQSNIVCINKAISGVDGLIKYYKGNGDCLTDNIVGHDMNFVENSCLGDIESIRLDTLLSEEKLINLIKIDVEGAELSVLCGLNGIIDRVKHLVVECHLDGDWNKIINLIINSYGLTCTNIMTGEKVNVNSKRAYQLFCEKL